MKFKMKVIHDNEESIIAFEAKDLKEALDLKSILLLIHGLKNYWTEIKDAIIYEDDNNSNNLGYSSSPWQNQDS